MKCKELEALERIEKDLVLLYDLKMLGLIGTNKHISGSSDIDLIKQALTPPTADEIVKEANEYFDNIVWYDKVDKIFMIGEDMLSLDICPLKLAHKITSFFMAMEEK